MLRWLRANVYWLFWEPRPVWLAVLVVAAALIAALRYGATERDVQIAGGILQALGIVTVVWGIHQTRKLFGRPKLVTVLRQWLERRPVYGGRIVSASVKITVGPATLLARGYGTEVVRSDAAIEERVEVLEKNLKRVNERIDHVYSEMDDKFKSHAERLEREEQSRSTEDKILHSKIEVAETGGVHISLIGALWLLVGVMLSTMAPEIAKWLN